VALSVAPENSEEVPAGHNSQEAAPAALEKAPGGHAKHAALEAEPSEGLYVPTAHCAQPARERSPRAAPKRPAGHAVGTPPLQKDPAGQIVQEVAPGPLNVPAAQGRQLGASVTLLKVPAAQGKQEVTFVSGSDVRELPA
jgi:hypothetical protein